MFWRGQSAAGVSSAALVPRARSILHPCPPPRPHRAAAARAARPTRNGGGAGRARHGPARGAGAPGGLCHRLPPAPRPGAATAERGRGK